MVPDSDIEARLLKFAICFNGRLPPEDIKNSSELISKREWGVGLEVLCAQLSEHEVILSADEVVELNIIASIIDIDITGFGLKS